MKTVIATIIVLAAISVASPAMAQSFDADNGTGNIAATAGWTGRSQTRTVREYPGVSAYAMSPRRKAGFAEEGRGTIDTTTGGGSPGYNEMLRNW
ncbi:MAG TPA: hypothetical protein VFL49_06840 [Pseudolabrys sp.]|nr:hypothetical protein [Pseudolabrys sp.]